MPPKCFQSLSSGQRCSAPAINGSKYCRHHDPQRPPRQIEEETRENEALSLPPLVDKPSVLAALNEVVQALAERRIKRSVAETLLSAIKLANRLLTEIAEAGLTVISAATQFRTPTVALAASGDRPKAPFNPALRYPASHSDEDPSTARLVKELLAQSHQLAKAKKLRAKR